MQGINEKHLKKVLDYRRRIGFVPDTKNLMRQLDAGLVRTVWPKENHDG